MNRIHPVARRVLAGLAVCILAAGCNPAGSTGPKIKINALDQLPQHTYAVNGKVADMLESEAAIKTLAAEVRKDIEADLAKYEIDDASTLQKWYGTLQTIDLIEGDDASALRRIEQVKELESKESKKLTGGLITAAYIAAKEKAGAQADQAALAAAFENELRASVSTLPWDVVQDAIKNTKGRMEIFSRNLLIGIVQANIEPSVAQTGSLNAAQAASVLSMYVTLTQRLPFKDRVVAAYQDYIDEHNVQKPDIWQARSVTLPENTAAKPVLVAVWDSGADDRIFQNRMWTNPNEQPNGKDDDGNGYVDDIHGIAYDYNARRDTGTLVDLAAIGAADRMPNIMKYMKGFTDSLANIDSPEASKLKQHLGGLSPEQVSGFLEDLSLAGNYAHGTHVAGIMVDGNPFARILVGRHSYDYHNKPVARTLDWGERDAAKCRDSVAYFKQHGVRVVNMSWGEALKDAQDSLEANGIGATPEERRELARKVFKLQTDGLYQAMKNAPEILFACAAGNADNDVEFDADIPSSFDLPNVIVVGAVDQAGDPTSFTSFGRTVQVYANGFEVESYVPGGRRMKMSGTSMASPQVANLAAKVLAIAPSLKPSEVIALIKEGATRTKAGDNEILLIHPQKTIELAKSK